MKQIMLFILSMCVAGFVGFTPELKFVIVFTGFMVSGLWFAYDADRRDNGQI